MVLPTNIRSQPPETQDLVPSSAPPSPHVEATDVSSPASIPPVCQPIPLDNSCDAAPSSHSFPSNFELSSSNQPIPSPDNAPSSHIGRPSSSQISTTAPHTSHSHPSRGSYLQPPISSSSTRHPTHQEPPAVTSAGPIHPTASQHQPTPDSDLIPTALHRTADTITTESPIVKGIEKWKNIDPAPPPQALNFDDNRHNPVATNPTPSRGLSMSSPLRREVERCLAAHTAESISNQGRHPFPPLDASTPPPAVQTAPPPVQKMPSHSCPNNVPASTQVPDANVMGKSCAGGIVQGNGTASAWGGNAQQPVALDPEPALPVEDDRACRAVEKHRQTAANLASNANRVLLRGRSRGIPLRSVPIHNSPGICKERNESESGEPPATLTQLTPPTPTRTDNEDEFASCSLPLGGMGQKAKAELETGKYCRRRARLQPVFEADSDFEDSEPKPPKGASTTRRQLRSESNAEKKKDALESSQSNHGKTRERVETRKTLKSKKIQGMRGESRNCTNVNRTRSMFDDDDDDFVEKRPYESGVKVGLRRSARKRKLVADYRENVQLSSPPAKRKPTARNRASPARKRLPSKAQATAKAAKATDPSVFGESPKRIYLKPLGSQGGGSTGAVETANDDEQIGSQGTGSQTLDICVEALGTTRKKKGRRYPERLYRSLTEEDLSLIRQAFTKVYRTPPSNGKVQGCYEFDRGRQMTEEMKKQVWENDLKPWSDRWWQLYQDFGKIGRRIKKEKEPRDVKPDLNMRELTRAAAKFRKEHGEIQPERISFIM